MEVTAGGSVLSYCGQPSARLAAFGDIEIRAFTLYFLALFMLATVVPVGRSQKRIVSILIMMKDHPTGTVTYTPRDELLSRRDLRTQPGVLTQGYK
jgi:hypothetical protein